jgi:GNAT superfamily N-acetyltransferase
MVGPEDDQFLRELYASIRPDLTGLPLDEGQKNALIAIQYEAQRRQYAEQFPNAEHYVVLFNSIPSGRYIHEIEGNNIIGIDLAILPRFQGHGIGSAVIRASLKSVRKTAGAFSFHVLTTNMRAVDLYRRLGCTIKSGTPTHLEMEWVP